MNPLGVWWRAGISSFGFVLGHSVCIFSASLFFHSAAAGAQPTPAESEPPPAGALSTSTQQFCSLPLCRDAEGLRSAGDPQGALKLYRYIQDEVDVDEKVVPKQLLWFTIAVLHGELQQPQQGLEALQKYQLYIATRPDSELPVGQRRADSERLAQGLRAHQARVRIGTTVPGLRVRIDGKEVGVTPLGKPVQLSAGRHHVELGDGQADSQEVDVAAGQEVLIWPMKSAPRELALTGGAVDGGRAARPRWRLAVAQNILRLSFSSSTVSITNTIIAGNSTEPSMNLIEVNGGSGVFQLNTVAYNSLSAKTAPVLSCVNAAGFVVKNSIFVQNGSTQQLASGCAAVASSMILGTGDTTPGPLQQEPAFAAPAQLDLQLQPLDPKNREFIFDKAVQVNPPAEKNVDHDYYGTPRPQGTGHDIGAFELVPR